MVSARDQQIAIGGLFFGQYFHWPAWLTSHAPGFWTGGALLLISLRHLLLLGAAQALFYSAFRRGAPARGGRELPLVVRVRLPDAQPGRSALRHRHRRCRVRAGRRAPRDAPRPPALTGPPGPRGRGEPAPPHLRLSRGHPVRCPHGDPWVPRPLARRRPAPGAPARTGGRGRHARRLPARRPELACSHRVDLRQRDPGGEARPRGPAPGRWAPPGCSTTSSCPGGRT